MQHIGSDKPYLQFCSFNYSRYIRNVGLNVYKYRYVLSCRVLSSDFEDLGLNADDGTFVFHFTLLFKL